MNGIAIASAGSVSTLTVNGTGGDDYIDLLAVDATGLELASVTLLGGDGSDWLLGTDIADTIDGGSGNDAILGCGGNDTLIGSTGDDIIQGDEGDDVLDGGDGEDFLDGGAGDDELALDESRDRVADVADTDTLQLSSGDYIYSLSDGDLNITMPTASILRLATQELDEAQFVLLNGLVIAAVEMVENIGITGSSGNDSIDLQGLLESDIDLDAVSVSAGGGHDWIFGSFAGDAINGGDGNDVLIGGEGNDALTGGTGDDFCEGGYGNDTLVGGDGNDTLRAGDGDDWLFGGAGNDQLFLDTASAQFDDEDGENTVHAYDGMYSSYPCSGSGCGESENVQPTVNLSVSEDELSEAGSPSSSVVTISRSGPTIGALRVRVRLDGNARIEGDYSVTSTPQFGFVIIPPGASSTTFSVATIDDTQDDVDEEVGISIEGYPEYLLGTSYAESITIVDDDLPSAEDDSYLALQNETVTITAEFGVLANDTISPAVLYTLAVLSQPAHGSLSLSSDGSFSYTPATAYFGYDQFIYGLQVGGSTIVSAVVDMEVGKLRITQGEKGDRDDSIDVIGATTELWVGDLVQVYAKFVGPGGIRKVPKVDWTIPAPVFVSYDIEAGRSSRYRGWTDEMAKDNPVKFRWNAVPATPTVAVKADLGGGVIVTKSTAFTVKRPVGDVVAAKDPAAKIEVWTDGDGRQKVGLGRDEDDNDGFKVKRVKEADSVEAAGEFHFLQLIVSTSTYYEFEGTSDTLRITGTELCDAGFPSMRSDGEQFVDSPSVFLDVKFPESDNFARYIDTSTEFKNLVMWKSNSLNSSWVTIRRVDWGWDVAVSGVRNVMGEMEWDIVGPFHYRHGMLAAMDNIVFPDFNEDRLPKFGDTVMPGILQH